jgi:hypothetical protein
MSITAKSAGRARRALLRLDGWDKVVFAFMTAPGLMNLGVHPHV